MGDLQSSPTGPAEHWAGGSRPKSCNSYRYERERGEGGRDGKREGEEERKVYDKTKGKMLFRQREWYYILPADDNVYTIIDEPLST